MIYLLVTRQMYPFHYRTEDQIIKWCRVGVKNHYNKDKLPIIHYLCRLKKIVFLFHRSTHELEKEKRLLFKHEDFRHLPRICEILFVECINAFRRRQKYIRQQSLLILPWKVGEHISGGTEEPPHYVIT